MKITRYLSPAAAMFLGWTTKAFAQTSSNYNFQGVFQGLTGQTGLTGNTLIDLAEAIGGFLLLVGATLAGIAIITSGIMYMSAGSNSTRLGTAKAIFKNGVIGALIIFTVGIIITTIANLAIDPFGPGGFFS